MVNSPWKQPCAPCPSQEEQQIKPHHFERCQWQKGASPSLGYLVYRWAVCLQFLIVMFASFFGGDHSKRKYQSVWLWFVFLTNWGYMMCVTQSVIALWIVQKKWIKNKTESPRVEPTEVPRHYKVYWVFHSVAVSAALTVTIVYWSKVYDPALHNLDAQNVLVHAANSFFMLLDLLMVSHPYRLLHIVYPCLMAVVYTLFSFIYYSCGGTDRDGNPYVYPLMDWRSPGSALTFTAGSLVVLFAMHCLVYPVVRLRCCLARRWMASSAPIPLHIVMQEKPFLIEMP